MIQHAENSHFVIHQPNLDPHKKRTFGTIMFAPSPSELAKDATKEQTEVEQLGTITLEELNKYHCNNEERRLLSLFGIIFDVTSSDKGYGKNGACKLLLST